MAVAYPTSATDRDEIIAIRDAITSVDTQARVTLREATIREYAELIADGTDFPPIVVFDDGTNLWLADGFHRHAAHKLAGKQQIRAIIKLGAKRDATRYACRANGQHGLPMTTADKRRSVELMLDDPEVSDSLRDTDGATWTQRKVARHCGVSHTFVANLIREREQFGNITNLAKQHEVITPPVTYVDEVLDHADAPEQPHTPHITFSAPQISHTNGDRLSNSPYEVRSYHAPHPAPAISPAPPNPMMTVIIAWSYANADGETIEGEISIREIDQMPAGVRATLLNALGSR